jgi:WS/DGAT/MGAT family acyltransferase
MRQLTGQDTIYLDLEGDETAAHASALMIMDQSTAPGGHVTFKQVLEHVENCLPDLPILMQKVVQVPLQLDYPFLGFDENFDLEFHVRHIALPKPGDWRQLCIQAARIHARGLDLRKPLWEMYIIESVDHARGYRPGSFAVLLKIHHALIDGGAFVVLMSKLLDLRADTPGRKARTSIQTRAPKRSEALIMSLKSASLRPLRFGLLLGQLAPHYLKSRIIALAGRERRLAKPKVSFNGRISKSRVVEGAEFQLDQINNIRKLVKGATLNDVVLAICGGALRKYLSHHGELPEKSLVAGAPVNLDTNRVTESDNNISLVQFPIQTDIEDPRTRLKEVCRRSKKAKANGEVVGLRNIGELSKQIPAPLLSLATGLLYNTGLMMNFGQLFNLVITNVPGPSRPLYFCGAELRGMYGLAPLAHTIGLVISQFSYNGKLYFAVTGDRGSIADPEFLVDCIRGAFDEYTGLVTKAKSPPKRRSSRGRQGSRKRAAA